MRVENGYHSHSYFFVNLSIIRELFFSFILSLLIVLIVIFGHKHDRKSFKLFSGIKSGQMDFILIASRNQQWYYKKKEEILLFF